MEIRERVEALRAAFEVHTRQRRHASFPGLDHEPLTVEVEYGPKYARIVRCDASSRSASGFVNLATGDIYYPAGWRGPALNRVRGSVLAEDYGLSAFGDYGVKTLR